MALKLSEKMLNSLKLVNEAQANGFTKTGRLTVDQVLDGVWDRYNGWFVEAAEKGIEYTKVFSNAHFQFGYTIMSKPGNKQFIEALAYMSGNFKELEDKEFYSTNTLEGGNIMQQSIVKEAFSAIRDIKPGNLQSSTYFMLQSLGQTPGMREAIKPVTDGIALHMFYSDYASVRIWVASNKAIVDAAEKAAEEVLTNKSQGPSLEMIAALTPSDEAWAMLDKFLADYPKEAAKYRFQEELWARYEKAVAIDKTFAFEFFFQKFPVKAGTSNNGNSEKVAYRS